MRRNFVGQANLWIIFRFCNCEAEILDEIHGGCARSGRALFSARGERIRIFPSPLLERECTVFPEAPLSCRARISSIQMFQVHIRVWKQACFYAALPEGSGKRLYWTGSRSNSPVPDAWLAEVSWSLPSGSLNLISLQEWNRRRYRFFGVCLFQ